MTLDIDGYSVMEFVMKRRSTEKGQVIAEYAMLLTMFAVIGLTLMGLLAAFMEYGNHIIWLVSVNIP